MAHGTRTDTSAIVLDKSLLGACLNLSRGGHGPKVSSLGLCLSSHQSMASAHVESHGLLGRPDVLHAVGSPLHVQAGQAAFMAASSTYPGYLSCPVSDDRSPSSYALLYWLQFHALIAKPVEH